MPLSTGISGLHTGIGGGGVGSSFDYSNKLVVIAGQSNAVGQGNITNIDSGLAGLSAVTTYPNVQLAHHCAPGVADPPVFTDVPGTVATFRDLQPYAAAGAAGMGIELSLGRYLVDTLAMDAPMHIAKYAISGIDISKYLEGSGYPTAGPQLFDLMCTYIDSCIANSGKALGVFVWVQGESDADTDAESTGYQAKLTSFIASLRVRYGTNFLFVISRLNENQIGGFSAAMTTTRVHNVQTGQDLVAAASPSNIICVNTDRAYVNASQKEHYLPDGYWRLGNLLGSGIANKIAPTRVDNQDTGPAPYIQWIREASNGFDTATSGDFLLMPPVDGNSGDIEVLIGMHASSTTQNAMPALTTAQGFVAQGAGAQSIFSVSTIVGAQPFIRTANGSAPVAPLMTDLVVRKRGMIFSVRGSTGVDVTAFTGDNLNNATHTLTGVTTTVANTRVIFICCYFSGSTAAPTVFTAAGLSNVVIHRTTYANNNGQNACKIAVLSGTKAVAGATGTATFTTGATATVGTGVCIAFKP